MKIELCNDRQLKLIEMGFTIQIISNHILQRVPAIFICIKDHKYLFNIPEQQERFQKIYHLRTLKVPLFLFFTKTSTSSVGGLLTYIAQLQSRNYDLKCKLFVSSKMYQYLAELRLKLGSSMTSFSFFDLEKGRHQIGFRNQKIKKQLRFSKNYLNLINKLTNEYIGAIITQQNQNNAEKLTKKSNNNQKYYFEDQYISLKYFFVGKDETFYNYIGQANKKIFPEKKADFIILHYKTKQDIEQILENQTMKIYLQFEQNLNAIVHIVEGEVQVLKTEEFKNLLEKMGKDVKHVIYHKNVKNKNQVIKNSQSEEMDLHSHIKLTSAISEVFPQIMPNIGERMKKQRKLNFEESIILEDLYPGYQLYSSKNNHCISIHTHNDDYTPIGGSKYQIKKRQDGFLKNINFNHKVSDFEILKTFPKLVFLGTSANQSQRFRNVSGILLRFRQSAGMLMDCGEGTYLQLLDHYGIEKINEVLKTIKIIFITHMHIDHNLGLFTIISERIKAFEKSGEKIEKLFLIIPYNMIQWYDVFNDEIQDINKGCEVIFIQTITGEQILKKQQQKDEIKNQPPLFRQCSNKFPQRKMEFFSRLSLREILEKKLIKQPQIYADFLRCLKQHKIDSFKLVPVDHCPQSYAIVLEFLGTKISYSGDCRPSELFTKEAEKSKLMIHQSTYQDSEIQRAKFKMHSTTFEATNMYPSHYCRGFKSKSQMTVLTHFASNYKRQSMRHINYDNYYGKLLSYALKRTFIAFDHLEVHINEMEKLPEISRNVEKFLPIQSKKDN